MSQIIVAQFWNLIHRRLRYYEQSGLTDTQLIEEFTDYINLSPQTYGQNEDVAMFIPGLSANVEGKAYGSIKACADYLVLGKNGTNPATQNREKVVLITTTRNQAGTTAIANLFDSGTPYDYVNYVGMGHHCQVVFDYGQGGGVTPGNISRRVRFKDLTIFFGSGTVLHDRKLGNFIFDNCKLLFYRNVTLVNPTINDSTLLMNGNVNIIIEGGSIISAIANKNLVLQGDAQVVGLSDFNLQNVMLADPTI